jgi:hypothetical protein
MRLVRLVAALCAALLLAVPGTARAEERILSYLSDVQVRQDGSLDVAETIRVNAEGNRINRGIYRDFPTRYRTGAGREVRVGFEVQSVEYDGAPATYVVESLANGMRVRIGDAAIYIPHGEHSYTIRYRTTRQLGHFEGFDELYWNATGNGWIFPIDVAEARITLPSAAAFGRRSVYTGPKGSTAQNAEVVSEQPGRIVFRTTQPLGPEEGLTVAVSWPKGVVAEPSSSARMGWWLADNGPLGLAAAGLAGLLFYYFYAWKRAGRGPDAGTIVPLFSPPDDLSAAASRYIREMGFDNRAFAASIVQLGVLGRIRLVEGEKGWLSRAKTTIEKTGGVEGLPAPEAAMLGRLFIGGDSVLMDNKNHAAFGSARSALEAGLKGAYEGTYFKRNHDWSLFGLVLIIVAIWLPAALIVATGGAGENRAPVAIGGLVLLGLAVFLYKRGEEGTTARWVWRALGILIGLLALVAGFSTIVLAIDSGRALPLLIPLLSFPFAISAFWWMAAPTREGRALMDRITGFRRYLAITEEQRFETLHPPEKTPALFERYLPYAIALDVENQWAAKFATVLAAAAAAGQTSSMGWYVGSSDPWSDTDGFVSDVGSSLASSVSSASTAPGSSSGSGGGGSSGGGGGGGGGGGW